MRVVCMYPITYTAVFWMTLTPFSKKISMDFYEILVADVKLMLRKVLRVSRRYLPLFLRYRENPAGDGGGRNLPPAGRVLSFVICLNAFFASNATFGTNEPFFLS